MPGRAARCLGEFVALGVVTETLKSVIAVSTSPRVVTEARGWEGLERGARAAAAEECADGLEEHHVLGEELLEVGLEKQVHQGVVERRGLGKDGRQHEGQCRHLAGVAEDCPQGNNGVRGPGSQKPQAHSNAQLEEKEMEMAVP